MKAFPPPWGNYLLEDLMESPVPDPVGWWPQTLGWKVLGVLLLAWLGYRTWQRWQAWQRDAYRRNALACLAQLPTYQPSGDMTEYRQLPALLRSTAVQAFGRTTVSQVPSRQWEGWLDQQCEQSSFTDHCPGQLYELAYGIDPRPDAQAMAALLREISLWIRFHRRRDD